MRRQKPPSQRLNRMNERELVGWLCGMSAAAAVDSGCSVAEARAGVLDEVRQAFSELILDEHSLLAVPPGSATPEMVMSIPAALQRTMILYGRKRRDPYTE